LKKKNMNNTIMIADDSASVRKMIAGGLEEAGYRTLEAADGSQAMQAISEESPDVVLLDIIMPQLDGFQVLRRLKDDASTELIPVIMISSLHDVAKRVQAFEIGADDFLIKPIEKTELLARVKSLVKVKAFHDHMLEYQHELESDVQDKTQQLREAMQKVKSSSWEIIFRLCSAAEYRDEVTGNHIWRLGRYASVVAKAMGLDEETTESIYYAAPMHDVGKIGIPDAILLKPGTLSPGEWEIMKTHTTIGGQILQGSSLDIIRMAETIALTHHEKWDGSGYPRGLQGEDIPLIGRISAIADVFDALTSKRPYKEVHTLDRAFAIIREGRGTHFDPQVVDAFFSALNEILYIQAFEQDAQMNAGLKQELRTIEWERPMAG
jgi:putative two-component system response regulator